MPDLELSQYPFSADQLAYVEGMKQDWQDANKKGRGKIAKTVYEKFKKDNPEWDEEKKKRIRAGLHWWFHNHGRKRASQEKFKAVKRWNARMVVGVEREDELHEKIQAASNNASPGTPQYLSSYQKQLSVIWNKLPTGEQEKATETATEWNKFGPPPDQQLKNAEKQVFKYCRSFSRQLKRSAGVDCIIFTTYQNKKKEVVVEHHDYMAELGGKAFFKSNPSWRDGDIVDSLMQHGQLMYGTDQVAPEPRSHTSRKPYVKIDCDELGHPLLPPREEWPGTSQPRKALIRAFVAIAYRRATGNVNSIVPWLNIQEEQRCFIDDEFMPANYILREPSKLKEQEMLALFEFWYDRQESGVDIPFRFKAYRLTDGTFMVSHEGAPVGNRSSIEDDWLGETKTSKKKPRRKSSQSGGKQPAAGKAGKSSGASNKKVTGHLRSGRGRVRLDDTGNESSGESFNWSNEDVNSDEEDDMETASERSHPSTFAPLSFKPSRPVPRPILKNRESVKSLDDGHSRPSGMPHMQSGMTGILGADPKTQAILSTGTTSLGLGKNTSESTSAFSQFPASGGPLPTGHSWQPSSHVTSFRSDMVVDPDGSDEDAPLPPDAKKGPPKNKRKRQQDKTSQLLMKNDRARCADAVEEQMRHEEQVPSGSITRSMEKRTTRSMTRNSPGPSAPKRQRRGR